jgi:hypothetical protein
MRVPWAFGLADWIDKRPFRTRRREDCRPMLGVAFASICVAVTVLIGQWHVSRCREYANDANAAADDVRVTLTELGKLLDAKRDDPSRWETDVIPRVYQHDPPEIDPSLLVTYGQRTRAHGSYGRHRLDNTPPWEGNPSE